MCDADKRLALNFPKKSKEQLIDTLSINIFGESCGKNIHVDLVKRVIVTCCDMTPGDVKVCAVDNDPML